MKITNNEYTNKLLTNILKENLNKDYMFDHTISFLKKVKEFGNCIYLVVLKYPDIETLSTIELYGSLNDIFEVLSDCEVYVIINSDFNIVYRKAEV